MALKTLLIFGAKSTALEIREAAEMILSTREASVEVLHILGEDEDEPKGLNFRRIGDLGNLGSAGQVKGILSMANQELRALCLAAMEAHRIEPITLIHPDATVSPSARIGKGCFVAAGARVSAQAVVGGHSILNLNATFGHDSVCGEHTIVNPGAAISGNVTIGDRCLVGANAFIKQGLVIGTDCQIDAMTHLWRAMPDGHVATSRSLRVDRRIDLTEARRDRDTEPG